MTRRSSSAAASTVVSLALGLGAIAALGSDAPAQGRGGAGLPRITTAAPAPSGWGGMAAGPSRPTISSPRGYITTPGTPSRPGYSGRGDLPGLRTARPGYGAYGRGYGMASAPVGGSRRAHAPYTRWGVGAGCGFGCVSGGFGAHVGRYPKYVIGYPLFGAALFYPYYYDIGYSAYTEVTTHAYADDAPRTASKVIIVGTGSAGASDALTVESLGDSVRLSWLANGRATREVKLFVADSAKRELATRTTMPSTPTAIFEVATLSAPVAYVGVTVVFADGVTSTTLVPYRGGVTRSSPR